jgi:hypothetical protein
MSERNPLSARCLQPIVQKPEQADALISGTVTAMRTIGYPVKPVRNRTAFGVRDTQNDSAVSNPKRRCKCGGLSAGGSFAMRGVVCQAFAQVNGAFSR